MYEDTIMYRLTSEQASGIEPSYERDLSQRNYTAHTHTVPLGKTQKRTHARTSSTREREDKQRLVNGTTCGWISAVKGYGV